MWQRYILLYLLTAANKLMPGVIEAEQGHLVEGHFNIEKETKGGAHDTSKKGVLGDCPGRLTSNPPLIVGIYIFPIYLNWS